MDIVDPDARRAPLWIEIVERMLRGEIDEARQLQLLAQQVIDAAAAPAGELAGFKALGSVYGVDCGPVRAPLAPVTPEQLAALRAEVTRLGFGAG